MNFKFFLLASCVVTSVGSFTANATSSEYAPRSSTFSTSPRSILKKREQVSAAVSSRHKKEVRVVEDFLNINQINEKIMLQDEYLNICMGFLHRNLEALKELPFNGTTSHKKIETFEKILRERIRPTLSALKRHLVTSDRWKEIKNQRWPTTSNNIKEALLSSNRISYETITILNETTTFLNQQISEAATFFKQVGIDIENCIPPQREKTLREQNLKKTLSILEAQDPDFAHKISKNYTLFGSNYFTNSQEFLNIQGRNLERQMTSNTNLVLHLRKHKKVLEKLEKLTQDLEKNKHTLSSFEDFYIYAQRFKKVEDDLSLMWQEISGYYGYPDKLQDLTIESTKEVPPPALQIAKKTFMAEVDAKEEYFKKTYKQAFSTVISPSHIHQEIEKVIKGLQKLKFLSHKVGVEKDNLFLEEYKDKAGKLFLELPQCLEKLNCVLEEEITLKREVAAYMQIILGLSSFSSNNIFVTLNEHLVEEGRKFNLYTQPQNS